MALVLADRVRETTTVTGTGTATLLGAVSGYQSFSAVGNANTTYYVIANQSATEWEVGIGTYTSSGTTLSRDTVLSSSNSGSLVNFSAGTKDVFVDYPAGKAVYEDAAGNVDGYPITGGTINNTTIGATTPSTGVFTTLGVTTSINASSGSANADLNVNAKGSGNVVITPQSANAVGLILAAPSNSTSNSARLFFESASGVSAIANIGGNQLSFRTAATIGSSSGSVQALVSHTASAVNYHQLTGSATGSGPIHSVAGSDTNIDYNLTTKGTGAVNLNTGGGTQARISNTASAVNFIQLTGGASGATPAISIQGAGNNVNVSVSSKGTGAVRLFTNNTSQEQLQVSHTASAVNYVQVTGAATGSGPTISSQGSDANARLLLNAKGTSSGIDLLMNNSRQMFIGTNGSAVNYFQTGGSVAGVGLVLSAQGSDTNINAVVQPKGTGALQAQQTDSTATGGNARGANAVDWQTNRGAAGQVASASYSVVAGGQNNTASGLYAVVSGGGGNSATNTYSAVSSGLGNTASNLVAVVAGGQANTASGYLSFIGGGISNTAGSRDVATVAGGQANTAAGYHNFIGGGFTNSGTSASAVTTQSATMNATTAVTLSGSNASIKVGQLISGTSIASYTYVAAISGTSLTLSQAASGSSTSTLSFFTPHGVVVGGGNNQATGAYSAILGGGDAGTAANRNVASGDWSVVGGGLKGVASGKNAFVGGGSGAIASGTYAVVSGGVNNQATGFGSTSIGGYNNISNSAYSATLGGNFASTRGIEGISVFGSQTPLGGTLGLVQSSLLNLAVQTTDATATVLRSNASAASTTNQVILPNNSAYYFKVEIIANVTGGGNTSGWELKGVIKRGANAASTAIVGSVTSTLIAQDAGASTWVVSATADTTNGGLKITVTGQASTTIRWVAKASTTEVTF